MALKKEANYVAAPKSVLWNGYNLKLWFAGIKTPL